LSAKGFKNAFRCCPNFSENFPDFSRTYSHFSLSYFYLLEDFKIFFMSSKYFIWIVRVSIYLRGFFWDFWNFLSIFHALKHFLGFPGNVFALKIEIGK
jgi:hypothetical protein